MQTQSLPLPRLFCPCLPPRTQIRTAGLRMRAVAETAPLRRPKLRGRLFQISASCEDDRLVARPARAGGAPGALPARARGARQARSWRALGALPARGRRAHGARPVRAGCAPGSRPARARCASGACPAPRPVVKINVIPYKVVEKPKKSLDSTSFNIKIQ